jgi:hypothetical protein
MSKSAQHGFFGYFEVPSWDEHTPGLPQVMGYYCADWIGCL